jgi:hypothetical protein
VRNPAAVLLGLLNSHIVLTKRSAGLRSFSQHICLPGGMQDYSDKTMVNTAIREFNEELIFNGALLKFKWVSMLYSLWRNPTYPLLSTQ